MHVDVSHQPSKTQTDPGPAPVTGPGPGPGQAGWFRFFSPTTQQPIHIQTLHLLFIFSVSAKANRPKPAEHLLSFYLQRWRSEASSDSRSYTSGFPNVYRSGSPGRRATVSKEGPSNCGPNPAMLHQPGLAANTSNIKAPFFRQLQTSWGR